MRLSNDDHAGEEAAIKTSPYPPSSLLLAVLLAGICGCSPEPTEIDPPSGPVGTQVCFNPTPPRFVGVTGETCGWYVVLTSHSGYDTAFDRFYTYENCFELPSGEFFAGDVVTVEVHPDWYAGLAAYWCDAAFPQPPLDGLGVLYGTFLVTE